MMKKPKNSPLGIIKIALLIPAVLITLGLTVGITPQQKTIKGKVVLAETGEPVPGASIVIRNSTTGCVTDIDGTFMLNVDDNPELVISFVGYESLIVKASDVGKKPLELVVKTYDLDLESIPMDESKKVTGSLWFKASDGSDANPVFVLDGKVVTEIEDLDPGSIESVNVIKDPEDPLMKKYNARDGVIVITTKAGTQEKEVYYEVKEMPTFKEKEVFYVVDEMPTFNGGNAGEEFRKYIAKNLRYPESAAKKGISGRVIVQFMVNEIGKVVDAMVVRGVDPALDREALRVVDSSPRWTPGKQNGKPVNVFFNFPVNFVIDASEKDNNEKSGTLTINPADGSEAYLVYVVDGIVVNEIKDLDPELIESVAVFKDPENPLVKKYNARDGVIVITTKEAAAKGTGTETFEKDGEIFYIVEDMPKFPGGLPALKTYIYSNLEYPEKAKIQGIEGEVKVRFLINQKGKVEKSEILRSSYRGFDAPALKVVNEMPDWTPGMQRGKAVKVWYVMTIKFNDEKK